MSYHFMCLLVGGLMLTKFFFILGKQKGFVYFLDLGLLLVWAEGETACTSHLVNRILR